MIHVSYSSTHLSKSDGKFLKFVKLSSEKIFKALFLAELIINNLKQNKKN
jgi:hypothetical protein